MTDIEIFLRIDNKVQLSFLSIPRSDIERIAFLPFRWMRYVMFAICGARGDLSTTPNGPPVDYDRTECVDAQNKYYYRPLGLFAFVDYEGLKDRLSSASTASRNNPLRDELIRRDGPACVVTPTEAANCQGVHLIPHSKGDEYIAKVIELRSAGDDSVSPSDVGIDDKVNAVLLSKHLHTWIGKGRAAFIKTPNYGLRPGDIKAYRRDDSLTDYITFQWLKEPENYNPTFLATFQNGGMNMPEHLFLYVMVTAGANIDALFQGNGEDLPTTVILDYVYGVAAYKAWHGNPGDVPTEMDKYRELHYAKIPPLVHSPPDDAEDHSPAPDDPTDSDYIPRRGESHKKATRRGESELAKAMDELNMVLMYLTRGIMPGEAAECSQKEIEHKELAAQEEGRRKVEAWQESLST